MNKRFPFAGFTGAFSIKRVYIMRRRCVLLLNGREVRLRPGLLEFVLQRFAGLQKILNDSGLLNKMAVLLAVAIFTLGWRSPQTAGATWLDSIALFAMKLISDSGGDTGVVNSRNNYLDFAFMALQTGICGSNFLSCIFSPGLSGAKLILVLFLLTRSSTICHDQRCLKLDGMVAETEEGSVKRRISFCSIAPRVSKPECDNSAQKRRAGAAIKQ